MNELIMEPAMALALAANFGSVARWRDDFVALDQAPAAGPGWRVLGFQPREGTLLNRWSAEPVQATDDSIPLLALPAGSRQSDDAAADRRPLDARVADIDWALVYRRYQDAVHAASESCGAAQDELASALVVDVRRAGVFEQAPSMIPRAQWCDPATVGEWARELPAGRSIVVYCVYGHEVGRVTAMRLRASGLQARYLRGGIDGWLAAGRPTVPKGATS